MIDLIDWPGILVEEEAEAEEYVSPVLTEDEQFDLELEDLL